jgi:hypothetical protein
VPLWNRVTRPPAHAGGALASGVPLRHPTPATPGHRRVGHPDHLRGFGLGGLRSGKFAGPLVFAMPDIRHVRPTG